MKPSILLKYEVTAGVHNTCCLTREILRDLVQRGQELDECSAFDLKVVLNELLMNAVNHGNKGDGGKRVKVTVGAADGRSIFFIVEDEGEGYDYKRILKDCLCIEESPEVSCLKESGRGLILIQSLCDSLKFNTRGNKVVVLKRV